MRGFDDARHSRQPRQRCEEERGEELMSVRDRDALLAQDADEAPHCGDVRAAIEVQADHLPSVGRQRRKEVVAGVRADHRHGKAVDG